VSRRFAWAAQRLSGLWLALAALAPTWAQTFPTRPVTMIVAFPAGGGTDIVARKVAQALGALWGQPVNVDNKGGAAGTIGTLQAARAETSGHTLFMATLGNLCINQHLYTMEIDPATDLAAITNVVGVNFVLVAHPSLPANSVQELIALARQRPGKLNYASSGSGGAPHLAGELFQSMSGTKMTHVPYKGSGPSFTDLIGGQVDLTFDSLVQALPYIQSGRLKALAVLGARRSPLLPNVPTVAEAGVPGYEFTNWFGLVAPAGTPKNVIAKLHADVSKVLREPEMHAQLEKMGADVINNTPAQFAAQMKAESIQWGKTIKEANIKHE
jgi:tripartite-type tricarboxylate transporter receptor subunit TctC